MEDKTEYVVTVAGSEGYTFTFELAEPASIVINEKAIPEGSYTSNHSFTLTATVYDENGNDITVDYASDIVWTSSPVGLVTPDGELNADVKDGQVIAVKVEVEGTNVSTGFVLIEVQARKVAEFKGFHIATAPPNWNDLEEYNHSIFVEPKEIHYVYVNAVDQFGDAYSDFTVQSQTLDVLVADANNNNSLTPITTGTANLKISDNNSNWSTTVTVEVIPNAVVDKLEVDRTSVSVVAGSGIGQEVNVKLYDQYGNLVDGKVTVEVDGELVTVETVEGEGSGSSKLLDVSGEETYFKIVPGRETGTTTVKVSYDEDLEVTINVSVVEPGTFARYEIASESGSNKIEGLEEELQLHLYAIDNNGNRINEVTEDAEWSSSDEEVATVSNDEGEKGLVTSMNGGKATITAKLNGVKVATFEVEVEDTTPALAHITFSGNTIQLTEGDNVDLVNEITELVSAAKDQHGEDYELKASDIDKAVSGDTSVVQVEETDGQYSLIGSGKGTTTLTVVFKLHGGETLTKVFYVNVEEAEQAE